MKTNTKFFTATFILLAIFICSNTKAQSVGINKFRFGIGVDGLLPVGDFHNAVNFGLGVSPRLQYEIANNVALTFTSGFYHFFTKPLYIPAGFLGSGLKMENHLDIIPVKVGIKAFVSSSIYLGAEAGAGFEVEDGGGPTKLIASPGVGYASKRWDVSVRYEDFLGQNNNYGVLGLRIAYGFGL